MLMKLIKMTKMMVMRFKKRLLDLMMNIVMITNEEIVNEGFVD